MILIGKYTSPFSLFSFSNPNKSPAAFASKPFEETLIKRLSSLLPFPDSPASIPLPWLSLAIDLLTLTLADLTAIISDPSLSLIENSALSSLLDSTISLLDACNVISSAADQILHGSLIIRLAIRLISSPFLDGLRRARSAIAQWEAEEAFSPPFESSDLLRLRTEDSNRWSAICAVEAVADLVVRSALAFLGKRDEFLIGFRVSTDFAWAGAFNEVVEKVRGRIYCGEIGGEMEAAKKRVKELGIAVEEVEEGGGRVTVTEALREAVRGAEEATEELTEGMDRLSKSVNALFRSALESREAALHCFRVRSGICN